MARKSKTQQLTEGIAGQHLALSVAAHLARTQLVPDPLKVYDGQHLTDMLNVVAQALARTAPLHVIDPAAGEPRAAQRRRARRRGGEARRDHARAEGRPHARRRVDQAQRPAPGDRDPQGGRPARDRAAAARRRPPSPGLAANLEAVRARFAEVEGLLTPPLLPAQVERAKAAAVWIARHAPHGRIANLAMQLMSALHETRGTEEIPGGFRMALARLRAALEQQSLSKRHWSIQR